MQDDKVVAFQDIKPSAFRFLYFPYPSILIFLVNYVWFCIVENQKHGNPSLKFFFSIIEKGFRDRSFSLEIRAYDQMRIGTYEI